MAMARPLLPTVAKLATLRPPLMPHFPFVPRVLTVYLPLKLALFPLHTPIVWPLPFLH
jgi:hypothetical protein